jgi:hypothetical protein
MQNDLDSHLSGSQKLSICQQSPLMLSWLAKSRTSVNEIDFVVALRLSCTGNK